MIKASYVFLHELSTGSVEYFISYLCLPDFKFSQIGKYTAYMGFWEPLYQGEMIKSYLVSLKKHKFEKQYPLNIMEAEIIARICCESWTSGMFFFKLSRNT